MFRPVRALSIRILGDSAIWGGLSGLFILIFVGHFGAPSPAILPHLKVVAYFALLAACFRYLLYRWAGNFAACVIGAAISAGILFLLAVYYAAVLVGMDGWGRVISYQLILTYVDQCVSLLEVLAMPPTVAGLAALILYLLIFYSVWLVQRRWDWVPAIASFGSSRFSIASALLSGVILGILAYQFLKSPPVEAGEPLALTLNPNHGKSILQTHRVAVSTRLDSIEASARASYQPVPGRDFANVIVIVVDALRADHLSFNGYHRPTSRHLDQLKRDGKLISIRNAHGTCAESSCGLMALASSRNLHAFPGQPFSLQEVLKRHEFRLHMILSGDHTNFYGLRTAYGALDSYADGSSQTKYYMNDDRLVIDELSRFPAFGGIPTFFQFHLMSTHGLSKRDPNNAPFKPYHNYYADLVRKTVMVDSERETGYVNYYDNGVVRTDQAIRSILDSLEGKNYLRKALVVITADHGELLGEHGLFSHAKTVFAPVLDIPLMFLRYGYQPSDEISPSVVASQIDIAPTILAELGMPIPSSWSGFPLQRLKLVPAEDRFLFFQQGAEFGLIESGGQRQRWKYWVNANTGHEYAFDLLADPGEMRNGIDGVPSARREKWRVALLQAEVQARESSGIELLPE